MSLSDVFRSSDFRALRACLELRPLFKTWPDDAILEYTDSIIDEEVEVFRKERLNNDLLALHRRNYNKKNCIDVLETSSDNLSIPFE